MHAPIWLKFLLVAGCAILIGCVLKPWLTAVIYVDHSGRPLMRTNLPVLSCPLCTDIAESEDDGLTFHCRDCGHCFRIEDLPQDHEQEPAPEEKLPAPPAQ